MKSTAVFLLCSLFFAAACQLGRSHIIVHHHGKEDIHQLTKHSHVKDYSKDPVKETADQESILDIATSMLPGMDTLATRVNSVSSSTSSVANFILSATGWILVPLEPVDFVLKIVVTLCGAPFLVYFVPIVTRATAVLLLSSLFVPYETTKSFVTHLAYDAYSTIRPTLVHYAPQYERVESFVLVVYGTAGTISSAVMTIGSAVYSGASKAWEAGSKAVDQISSSASMTLEAGYKAADKIGQVVENVANTTAKFASKAVEVAKNVPKFVKEVAKKAFTSTPYTSAQIEAARQQFATEFNSRGGTSSFPSPSLPKYEPYILEPTIIAPDSPTPLSSSNDAPISAEKTDDMDQNTVSSRTTKTNLRSPVMPPSKPGNKASGKMDQIVHMGPPPIYVNATKQLKLNPDRY